MLEVLSWARGIGVRFLRVAPGATLLIVLVTLISQIAFLVASLLPLKVVLLLGAEKIPGFFPAIMQGMERGDLIVALSALALAFYLIHLLAERGIARLAARATERLLASTSKLVLFDNQSEVASRSYQRYSQSLASLIFATTGFFVLVAIYPGLAVFFGLYLLSALLLTVLYQHSSAFRMHWQDDVSGGLEKVAALGFLGGFALIVTDHLAGGGVSVLLSVLSLLLLRQLLRHCARFSANLVVLYAQRQPLNALFFLEHTYHKHVSQEGTGGAWRLLEPAERSKWLPEVLAHVTGIDGLQVQSRLEQTGVPDVVALHVTARTGELEVGPYWVKIFSSNRTSMALHEADLFADGMLGPLPMFRFLGADLVSNLHCHVFEWQPCQVVEEDDLKERGLQLKARLLSLRPPAELVARYCRSRPLLWQRFNAELLERLHLVADAPEHIQQLQQLIGCLDALCERLMRLPLAIVNPDQKGGHLLLTTDDEVFASHWGRWGLEPVGAGWPFRGSRVRLVPELLHQAAQQRHELQDVALNDFQLSALCSAVESYYQRQHYQTALELLAPILLILGQGRADPLTH